MHACVWCPLVCLSWQVEKNTGQQYHTMLSLNDCLDLAVERSAIFFRKIEIRQTCGEELVMLLSSLSAMWEGKRKGSSAAINKTSSGSNGNGNGGGGGNKRRGSKRKNSPFPSNSTVREIVAPKSSGCLASHSGMWWVLMGSLRGQFALFSSSSCQALHCRFGDRVLSLELTASLPCFCTLLTMLQAAQTSQDADAQEASSAAAVSQDLTAMDNSTAPPPPPQKKTCAPDQAAIC